MPVASPLLVPLDRLQPDHEPGCDELEALLRRPVRPPVLVAERELEEALELEEAIWNEATHPRWPPGSKDALGKPIGGEFMRVGQAFMADGHRWEITHIAEGHVIASEASGDIANAETRVFKPTQVAAAKLKDVEGKHGDAVPVIKEAKPAPPIKLWAETSSAGHKGGGGNTPVLESQTRPDTHDPSIPLPKNSNLTEEEWKKFGLADQLYYRELMARYGEWEQSSTLWGQHGQVLSKWNAAKAKNAAEGLAGAVQKVEAAWASQKGWSYGNQLNLVSFFEGILGSNKPSLVQATRAYERAREVESDFNAPLAWDLYNRYRDPEVTLRHKTNDSEGFIGGKLISGKQPWMSSSSNSFTTPDKWNWGDPNTVLFSVPIRGVTYHVALTHGTETEVVTADRLKLSPDNAVFYTPSQVPGSHGGTVGQVQKWINDHMGMNGAGGWLARAVSKHLAHKEDLPLPPAEPDLTIVSTPGGKQKTYTLPPDDFMKMVEDAVKKNPGKVIEPVQPVSQLNLKPGDIVGGNSDPNLRFLVIADSSLGPDAVRYLALGKGAFGGYDVEGEKNYVAHNRSKVNLHFDIPPPPPKEKGKEPAHKLDDFEPEGPKVKVKTFNIGDMFRLNGDDWEVTNKAEAQITVKNLSGVKKPEGTVAKVNAEWATQKLVEHSFEPHEGALAVVSGEFVGKLVKEFKNGKWQVMRPDGLSQNVEPNELEGLPSYTPQTPGKGDVFISGGQKYVVTNVIKKDGTVKARSTAKGAKVEAFKPDDPALATLFRPTDWAVGPGHKAGGYKPGDLVSGSKVKVRPYLVLGTFGSETHLSNLETGEVTKLSKGKTLPSLITAQQAEALKEQPAVPAPSPPGEVPAIGAAVKAAEFKPGWIVSGTPDGLVPYQVVGESMLNGKPQWNLQPLTSSSSFKLPYAKDATVPLYFQGVAEEPDHPPPGTTAPVGEVVPSELPNATSAGLEPFKWHKSGSTKNYKVSTLGEGQVFEGKGGKLWMVKQAGAVPIVTDGQNLFKVGGSAFVKLSESPFVDQSPPVSGPDKQAWDQMQDNTEQAPVGNLGLKAGDKFFSAGHVWEVTQASPHLEAKWGANPPVAVAPSLTPAKYFKQPAPEPKPTPSPSEWVSVSGDKTVNDLKLPVGTLFEGPSGASYKVIGPNKVTFWNWGMGGTTDGKTKVAKYKPLKPLPIQPFLWHKSGKTKHAKIGDLKTGDAFKDKAGHEYVVTGKVADQTGGPLKVQAVAKGGTTTIQIPVTHTPEGKTKPQPVFVKATGTAPVPALASPPGWEAVEGKKEAWQLGLKPGDQVAFLGKFHDPWTVKSVVDHKVIADGPSAPGNPFENYDIGPHTPTHVKHGAVSPGDLPPVALPAAPPPAIENAAQEWMQANDVGDKVDQDQIHAQAAKIAAKVGDWPAAYQQAVVSHGWSAAAQYPDEKDMVDVLKSVAKVGEPVPAGEPVAPVQTAILKDVPEGTVIKNDLPGGGKIYANHKKGTLLTVKKPYGGWYTQLTGDDGKTHGLISGYNPKAALQVVVVPASEVPAEQPLPAGFTKLDEPLGQQDAHLHAGDQVKVDNGAIATATAESPPGKYASLDKYLPYKAKIVAIKRAPEGVVQIQDLPEGATFMNSQPHLATNGGKVFSGHGKKTVLTVTKKSNWSIQVTPDDGKATHYLSPWNKMAKKVVVARVPGEGPIEEPPKPKPAAPAVGKKMKLKDMPDGTVYEAGTTGAWIKKVAVAGGKIKLEIVKSAPGGAHSSGHTWQIPLADFADKEHSVVSVPTATAKAAALGADGLPLHVGDIVNSTKNEGIDYEVTDITSAGVTVKAVGSGIVHGAHMPSLFVHKPATVETPAAPEQPLPIEPFKWQKSGSGAKNVKVADLKLGDKFKDKAGKTFTVDTVKTDGMTHGTISVTAVPDGGKDSDAVVVPSKHSGYTVWVKPVAKPGVTVIDPEAAGLVKPPKNAKPAITDYTGKTLTIVKPAGGTQGASIAKDAAGKEWLYKSYQNAGSAANRANRVATEALSNAILNRLGVKVPKGGIINEKDGPVYAYPYEAGTIQKSKWSVEQRQALAKDYVADVLLDNYDFAGLERDNVLWNANVPTRLDQGGTLFFRAMGAHKDFADTPESMWTMLTKGQAGLNGIGDFLSEQDLRDQAKQVAGKLSKTAVVKLVAAAPFKDEAMRKKVADALQARLAWLAEFADGKHEVPADVKALLKG